jgi:hypothetical protein
LQIINFWLGVIATWILAWSLRFNT